MECCKPIMNFLMIVMVSLVASKTEGSRTLKQLYLSPHHLANGPIVPHLPYWTPYYYPMPLAYPSLYGQPFIDNTKFIENETSDVDSTSIIDENSEAMGRQGPFLTFLQNLLFGGPPTPCPSCPYSCPVSNQPCAPCAFSDALATTDPNIKTCDPNGFSVARTGSITLTGLTDTTTVCEHFVAIQDPRVIIKVSCSALHLGGGSVWTNAVSALGAPSGVTNEVTVQADGTGVRIVNSNFFGISIANKAASGSATCKWEVGLTTINAFTTCITDGFTSANAGTIVLTGVTPGICLYVIAVQVPIAKVKVLCPNALLGGGVTAGNTAATATTPIVLNVLFEAAANIAVVKVRSTRQDGRATCNWNLGAETSEFTTCPVAAADTTAATGTIILSTAVLNTAKTCTYNIIAPNNAATITVKCISKDLSSAATAGDVTASFDYDTVTTPVTDAGVTSPLNYVKVVVRNQKTGGSASCSWSTN